LEKTPEYFILIEQKMSINADVNNLGWFQILAELAVTFFLVEQWEAINCKQITR
jgi:hypothetical protein